jgi:hypothetical protein
MPFYLVSAEPKEEKLDRLREELNRDAFAGMRPFGKALTAGLKNARREDQLTAIWEEEDYCSPPLAEERAAVLDEYFDRIEVEEVEPGQGWRLIENLPALL